MRTTVSTGLAMSPAFDIEDYDWMSHEFSTWSESMWPVDFLHVEVFLIPPPAQEAGIVIAGILVFLLSLGLVYLARLRHHVLFVPGG